MNAVVRAQQKRIRAGLAERHHRVGRVRIGESDRRGPGVQLPLDGRLSAWIDNRAGESRAQATDILICAGICGGHAGRPRPFVRPSCLNHLEIVNVDCGKVVERR